MFFCLPSFPDFFAGRPSPGYCALFFFRERIPALLRLYPSEHVISSFFRMPFLPFCPTPLSSWDVPVKLPSSTPYFVLSCFLISLLSSATPPLLFSPRGWSCLFLAPRESFFLLWPPVTSRTPILSPEELSLSFLFFLSFWQPNSSSIFILSVLRSFCGWYGRSLVGPAL